jgi:hypothetical protein
MAAPWTGLAVPGPRAEVGGAEPRQRPVWLCADAAERQVNRWWLGALAMKIRPVSCGGGEP